MTTSNLSIDLSRNELFDELGLLRLKSSYMKPEEKTPQDRFVFIATSFCNNDLALAQRLYDYISKHWLSPSSPQLSFGRTKQGLPIACFLPYLPDTTRGLIDTWAEVSELSVIGGGIGIGVGIRQPDEKSVGIIPHLRTYDASCTAYKQGQTRRGSYAAYLDITHPEIKTFLNTRRVSGDYNFKLMNIHNGINIPDNFMKKIWFISLMTPILKTKDCVRLTDVINELKNSDYFKNDEFLDLLTIENLQHYINETNKFDLVDPHTKKVTETVSATELWETIIITRAEVGEPFLHFVDTSNKALPDFQKKLGLSIKQSNLCSEISLPTDENRTAVCCLASLNLNYFDEWSKDDQFYLDVVTYLDNVLQYFIDNAPKTVKRAIYSASQERAIGVGALGFHSYLQSKQIAIESMEAYNLNNKIFKQISTYLLAANLKLGSLRGEAPDCIGTGRRFSHTMAIAPNATSSIIMGNTSPSCEPFRANVYKQDTLSGSHININKHLNKILNERIKDPETLRDVISSIKGNDGSVQHLDVLTDHEKKVFKTWPEINQMSLIRLAAARQKYIDQAQSTSLFFSPTSTKLHVHNVHLEAWKSGLKTLYYYRSTKIINVDKINHKIIKEDDNECTFCEG
ncbi:ribonucleotide reductase [Chloriridovirus anopheles1]|uniref:Ribonucleoside-diphosphate reductase n=1 Tax=Chloriridovirus anopheles1 TaxID=1465751 RepID=W8QF08_9VIRU|nr:ribonucleotide reductase [Anopheles minimus iridovirus]AHL67539.1 ribonucleotide reductase of class Ia (aerobic), alpha subunit [Anopheles minimus iridovirus]